jgi:hypothetical protein
VGKIVEPPRFPVVLVISTLAVIADLAGLTVLFLSDLPLMLKLAVAVPLAGIPIAVSLVYVGRRREWVRLSPRIRELESEVRLLKNQLPRSDEVRPAA